MNDHSICNTKRHGTQIAVRIEPMSIILNLLQQTSPTSPAKGYIKKVTLATTLITAKIIVLEEKSLAEVIDEFGMLLNSTKRKAPVALITATRKSTYRPDLVVMQVALYRLEKEGGQHEDAD